MKNVLLSVLILLVAALPAAAQEAPDTNLIDECAADFDPNVDYFPNKVEIEYAEGLEIEYFNNYKVVTVLAPWPGAEEDFRYVLVQCGTPAPEEGFEDAEVIEVPIDSIITMSAAEYPRLEALGALDALVGVDAAMYANHAAVVEMFEEGALVEIGEGASVNVELVLDTAPDIVLTNSTGSADWDAQPVLEEAGITSVVSADWMEMVPLGRAEWVKFTALFFNAEAAANAAFAEVRDDYEELATLTAGLPEEERPTVFANMPFEGTWYMAGGASYFAKLLEDAGASYLWAEDDSTGSLFLDFETVLAEAAEADYWLNPGMWASLDEGMAIDERFAEFDAFQESRVYNNNAATNAMGFSDYFESGVMRPDFVLADLIAIFHPDLLPDHTFVYYQRLTMGE